MRIRIKIQGLKTKKWEKIASEKKVKIFGSKIAIYLSLDLHNGCASFIPQKRTSSTSKFEFLTIVVHLARLDPDP
jgi:hypothetical protein